MKTPCTMTTESRPPQITWACLALSDRIIEILGSVLQNQHRRGSSQIGCCPFPWAVLVSSHRWQSSDEQPKNDQKPILSEGDKFCPDQPLTGGLIDKHFQQGQYGGGLSETVRL